MKVPHICPRCNDNFIPCNERPGEYPGAISRADDRTEICSACGVEEAMLQFATGQCEPVCAWPLNNRII